MLVGDIMQCNVVTVSEDEPLENVLCRMLQNGVRHAPVMRAHRLVGVISERNLLAHRARYGRDERVALIMTEQPYVTYPESSVAAASALMSAHKIGCLPVLSGERLIGIVTRSDLLALLALQRPDLPAGPALCALDVMQHKVHYVQAMDSLLDAALHMLQAGLRHLPVVDGELRVMGVVSDRDVRKAVGETRGLSDSRARHDALERVSAAEVMTGDAAIAAADTCLDTLGRRLLDEHCGALLIVDDQQRLIGVVSHADVLRALLVNGAAA